MPSTTRAPVIFSPRASPSSFRLSSLRPSRIPSQVERESREANCNPVVGKVAALSSISQWKWWSCTSKPGGTNRKRKRGAARSAMLRDEGSRGNRSSKRDFRACSLIRKLTDSLNVFRELFFARRRPSDREAAIEGTRLHLL